MAKQSRQEYLVSQAKLLPKEQQAAAIKQINAAAKAPGGISKDKLNQLNLGIERVLYGADARGGTAGAKPGYTPREEQTTVPDWVLEFQRSQQTQIESQKVIVHPPAVIKESCPDGICRPQIKVK